MMREHKHRRVERCILATILRLPTVLRYGPYRFYFYSHEPNEPPHIHVDRDDSSAKFWLNAVQLGTNLGFRARELTHGTINGDGTPEAVSGGLG
jgi:hypothetical protein